MPSPVSKSSFVVLAIFAGIPGLSLSCRSACDLRQLHTAQLSANWLRAAQFSLSLEDTLYCLDTTYKAPCQGNSPGHSSPMGDHHTPLRPVAVRRSHVVATASDTTQAQASSKERTRQRTLTQNSFPCHDAIILVVVVLVMIFAAARVRK